MHIENFSDIEKDFIDRVHSYVLCNAATIDSRQRPRSRILHPIWEGKTGWVLTHRHSYKSKHLANNPNMSLTYMQDPFKPVYIGCTAEWVDELAQKERIWELFKAAPEPLGFDPALTFSNVDDENTGLLKLTPWRISLVSFPAASHDEGQRVWRA